MTHLPNSFLGPDGAGCDPAGARYVVLPVPYEGTVSYAPGTVDGPAAILEASAQVELNDEELRAEFHKVGVRTLEPIPSTETPEAEMARVRAAADAAMGEGKFLLTLGGEHSITAPLVAAAADCFGELSVLQIDAHADLRDSYGGTKQSHASVMRRVLEITPSVVQVGIRNFSLAEAAECPGQVDRFVTPARVARDPEWIDHAIGMLGEQVYVTLDVDGFDPSEAPGVGTPEPGGLHWPDVTALLRRVCAERRVVAADIVEVRPIPPSNITEFLAARLAYKIIAYTQVV